MIPYPQYRHDALGLASPSGQFELAWCHARDEGGCRVCGQPEPRDSTTLPISFTEAFGNVNRKTGELVFRIPGGTERFIPARAYKALVKMAVALLPADTLPNFTKIIAWLHSTDDDLLPHMIVGISFSIIGNSPALLAAALLRRTSENRDTPYMLFVTTMGSMCLQIVPKADSQEGSQRRIGGPLGIRTHTLKKSAALACYTSNVGFREVSSVSRTAEMTAQSGHQVGPVQTLGYAQARRHLLGRSLGNIRLTGAICDGVV